MWLGAGEQPAHQQGPGADAARRVVVVGYPGSELLDIACVTSTLDLANRIAGRGLYRTELVSPAGRPVRCDSGLSLESVGSLQRTTGPIDTLIVSGGEGHEIAAKDPTIVAHIRRLAVLSRRVASVCTGATVLAAAGLLDGRRATTHWRYAAALAEQHPAVEVDPGPIYIRDGRIATSAGVTSALDLTLSLVAEDHSSDLARSVARALVTYLQRPGNQTQMSVFTAPDPDHALVRETVAYVTANLDGALDTVTLARRVAVSERQLHRLFVEHLGTPPGRFVRRLRLDTAAHLLAATTQPVGTIARRCGFTSVEALRQAFVQHYGLAPAQYRQMSAAGNGRRLPSTDVQASRERPSYQHLPRCPGFRPFPRCSSFSRPRPCPTMAGMSPMKTPPIVSPQEWEAARQQLLVTEKELTRARDALAARRRRMPWLAVDKEYAFDGPAGRLTLLDLFEGRRQLIVYRAFFEPGVHGWPDHACDGCSMMADQVAHLAHLNARDTTLAYVSRAPQPDIERVKARMGWTMPWYTMIDGFDTDFGVDEWHGTNAFVRDGDRVFRTYFLNARGDEALGSVWSFLDLTAFGRQEEWEDSPEGYPQTPPYEWWNWHDEYANTEVSQEHLDQIRRARASEAATAGGAPNSTPGAP